MARRGTLTTLGAAPGRSGRAGGGRGAALSVAADDAACGPGSPEMEQTPLCAISNTVIYGVAGAVGGLYESAKGRFS